MTDYLDGFQYVNQALNFFPHGEGFVDVKGTNAEGYKYFYVYNYTDHLGNFRVSYGFDPDTRTVKTLEENHYYPFGLKHTNYNTYKRQFKKEDPPTDAPPTSIPGLSGFSIKQVVPGELLVYKYKFNNREWQDELGLNVTAMDFRQYDPAIGRFNGIDKLAEYGYSITPYRFAYNNPVYWNDPTGLLENDNQGEALCPTCPNTPAFKPLIDDPNNTYVYDPETKNATKVIELEEVVITSPKKRDFYTESYDNHLRGKFLNDFTFEDAIWHYRLGKGKSVTVNLNSLNFDGITTNDFKKSKYRHQGHKLIYVNFLGNNIKMSRKSQGLIYGSIALVLIDDNTIMALPDFYDFNLRLKNESFIRDVFTLYGSAYNGSGTPYDINFQGTAKIE